MSDNTVLLQEQELQDLIKDKLMAAGLPEVQSEETAKHLTYADMCGVHSHGSVRVEYYAERISKGGITLDPELKFEKTGESTGMYYGDNAQGQYVANLALEPAIKMAKETGIGAVGVAHCGHTGTLSYYLRKIAEQDLVGLAFTPSDPMAVPFGAAEVYYGTNPLGFGAPSSTGTPLVFDMATTVQAWGKVLDARSKGRDIPATWAVDKDGNATTDPYAVAGLVPIADAKGYGLMMMVDVFAGILLDLPFGKHVSSMYEDFDKGRDLGQLYIILDPERFGGLEQFKEKITQTMEELNGLKPAEGFDSVRYPGQGSNMRYARHKENGVAIAKDIVEYLRSDVIHSDNYEKMGSFVENDEE